MADSQFITTLAATSRAAEAGVPVSRTTLRNWCSAYGIGRRVGGRWYVDPEKLDALLAGDGVAGNGAA